MKSLDDPKDLSKISEEQLHYAYNQLTQESLRSQMTDKQLTVLHDQAWKTLRGLMASMLLQSEFKLLQESAKKKLQQPKQVGR